MMYQEKFVAVVKDSKGRVLREINDEVHLPFGSEYHLHFKNLNSVRAQVLISIDGQDVLDGQSLVIGANQEAELHGFLKEQKVTHAFKFIQKTKQISDHRGDRIDDGLIRIEYRFEHPYAYYQTNTNCIRCGCFPCVCATGTIRWLSSGGTGNIYKSGDVYCCASIHNDTLTIRSSGNVGIYTTAAPSAKLTVKNDSTHTEGITVKGSKQQQTLNTTSLGFMEAHASVIVLRLVGVDKGKVVTAPLTTKTKLRCDTCGTKNRSGNQFCFRCGTALT